MTVECPTCSAPAEVHVSGEMAASVGDSTVRLLGAPVVRCVAGHVGPYPVDLAHRVEARVDELLLAATRKGLRRQDHCGACGARLTLLPRHTDTPVSLPLEWQVVTVLVEAPMQRCPDCGLEQLPSDVAGAVRSAIDAALDLGPPHGTQPPGSDGSVPPSG